MNEEHKRGTFCGDLLLSQMEMAVLQEVPNTECGLVTAYLLKSGVMEYVSHKPMLRGAAVMAGEVSGQSRSLHYVDQFL